MEIILWQLLNSTIIFQKEINNGGPLLDELAIGKGHEIVKWDNRKNWNNGKAGLIFWARPDAQIQ